MAAGGAVGAAVRWWLGTAMPVQPLTFPASTLLINALGSLLIGLLMAYVGSRPVSPYLRPFLGVGVLGGFTTFSTYALEVSRLFTFEGGFGFGIAYLVVTPLVAVVAALMGLRFGRALFTANPTEPIGTETTGTETTDERGLV